MNELINKLKEISSLSQIENLGSINTNALLYAIAKSQRYDLLNNSNIRLNIADKDTFEKLTDFLLSDEDIIYYMHRNGFSLSKDELNAMFNLIIEKYQEHYKFNNFLRDFFSSKEELNNFVKEHEDFFIEYLENHKNSVSYSLKDCDKFVELILKSGNTHLLGDFENYSLDNLKLLAQFSRDNKDIPYYLGNDRYAKHIFDMKESLTSTEFSTLLDLLKENELYDRNVRDSELTSFAILIKDNIDYLIDVVSQTNSVPKCLVESSLFRDECIKRNRIDLAVKCILPPDIIQNESLVNAYCKELNIEPKDFYERSKWVLNYHERNNNIFNTFLATSLKDDIFNLNKEHFERFINDVQVQLSISKLKNNELKVLSTILNSYSYDNYDISLMVVSIINNISDYSELINTINIESISEHDLKDLISVIQLPNNEYKITNMDELRKYDILKKQAFVNNFNSNDLNSNKDSLLKAIFNVDLKEAIYIDSKYCHRNDNSNVLDDLKNSELPSQIYNYLVLINKIVDCNNVDELATIYNNIKDSKIYDCEIPLEQYLRSKYTELYSQSLYRIDERNQIYGPKDNIMNQINYNGKNIQVCIPRVNFNFFIHCVGSCSLASDVTDKNYRNDWLDRPQLQDHFVACSYINEKGIFSLRAQGNIIFGFDSLENGDIMGMGNTDIDSIGRYANAYDGSRELQEDNRDRARFFVPSEMLKTVNDGYNEIVIERRNTNKSRNENFKRKPDYIIMMADSMEPENFNFMNNLYSNQLSFITDEDKRELQQLGDRKKIKDFLVKYKELIAQTANNQGIQLNDMANMYVDLILKAKYFEDCMKASSEFDIPLVVVDKTYYFNKILSESTMYDDDTKRSISELYSQSNNSQKRKIFDTVAKGQDVTNLLQPKQTETIRISI